MANGDTNLDTTGLIGKGGFERVCLNFPANISSPGLVSTMVTHGKGGGIMDYSVPRLQLQMIATFVLTESIHMPLKLLGLPKLISQILAGIILGPTVFKDKNSLITKSGESVEVLGSLSAMGFLFFLFLSGVKMDPSLVYKSGRKAVFIGLLTVLVPAAFCLITDVILGGDLDFIKNKKFFLSLTYSTTSFPVIHCLLSDLKIINSELGRLGLSAAIVSDIASMILMNIGKWVKILRERGAKVLFMDIGLVAAYLVVVFFVLRPAMKWMVRRTPKGDKMKDTYVYAVTLVFLIVPKITEYVNIFILSSPFMLGLAVPDGPPLGSALSEKFDAFIQGMFLPLFVSTCGMRIDLFTLHRSSQFAKKQAIAAIVTLIAKFGVSLLVPLLFKMPKGDSLALAFIMVSKGIFEIGSYSVLHDFGMISNDIFNIMCIMIILLASIVPFMVRKFYDPSKKFMAYQKRSISHCKTNEDLRIIGCIHVPGNVSSIINMLYALCPTKERPIAVDVLHLVKLCGRDTPIFIAHEENTEIVSSVNYSENVILSFNQFQRDNYEAVSVSNFTAVSPSKFMYEDVCNLAMDRLTSFVILPFHRRWCIDGSIESEDQTIRSMNSKILETAPCSVGILVEGHRAIKAYSESVGSSSSGSIAVIFLGGKDDREALALAKRISLDGQISITVYHLKPANYDLGRATSDDMLDNEMLKLIKETREIRCIEQQVNDGTETSSFLRSVVNDHQLIIVGRRYNVEDDRTSGLEHWSEFPEIGLIGDLLSSSDYGDHSLLVVQQQQLNLA